MYSQVTLDDGRSFTHLGQIFDRGLKVAGPNAPYIGHRPVVSKNPLKFADHFVWSTWGEVAKRRVDIGSGIENLFRPGGAVKTNRLETVGLWSANIPGELQFHMFPRLGTSIRVFSFHSDVSADAPLTRAYFDFAEWRILDLALPLYGKVVVPLYESFGSDSIGMSPISSGARFRSPT